MNEQFSVQNSFEVETETLDHFFGDNTVLHEIDIIKMDVQGAELDVLNGARSTLEKTKLLIVEQSIRSPYKEGTKYYEIDEFLRGSGFEILDIITTYRKKGIVLNEFDSIYINKNLKADLG